METGTLLARGFRVFGVSVISKEEAWEAERIGADRASKIYTPIFKGLEKQHKNLEKLANDKQAAYEEKKAQLKEMYESLQVEIEKLEKECEKKNIPPLLDLSAMFSSSVVANPMLLRFSPVSKESVKEYQKSIEEGFNKTKDIFEKKIAVEQDKIDKMIEEIAAFDKNKDVAFKKAMAKLSEQVAKKNYYKILLKG